MKVKDLNKLNCPGLLSVSQQKDNRLRNYTFDREQSHIRIENILSIFFNFLLGSPSSMPAKIQIPPAGHQPDPDQEVDQEWWP